MTLPSSRLAANTARRRLRIALTAASLLSAAVLAVAVGPTGATGGGATDSRAGVTILADDWKDPGCGCIEQSWGNSYP